MREGAYETCPKHGAYEPCDDSPSCGECRDDQVATAKDDVLRAALKDCEAHPGDERLCNEDDVCLCDLCAAVDRLAKLEGSR